MMIMTIERKIEMKTIKKSLKINIERIKEKCKWKKYQGKFLEIKAVKE